MLQLPAPPAPPSVMVVHDGFNPIPFIMLFGLIIGLFVLVRPLIRAWAHRLDGRSSDAKLVDAVNDMHARLDEVEQLHSRVAELEERLDFTERLLTQQREPSRLPLE